MDQLAGKVVEKIPVAFCSQSATSDKPPEIGKINIKERLNKVWSFHDAVDLIEDMANEIARLELIIRTQNDIIFGSQSKEKLNGDQA